MYSYIKSPMTKNDSNSVKMQKKYYQACMKLENLESRSNNRLKEIFDDLGGWPLLHQNWNETDFNWGRIVQKCTEHGLYYDWFLYIENEITYGSSNENLHVRYLNNRVTRYHLTFFSLSDKSSRCEWNPNQYKRQIYTFDG